MDKLFECEVMGKILGMDEMVEDYYLIPATDEDDAAQKAKRRASTYMVIEQVVANEVQIEGYIVRLEAVK
jgi:hypothetical protein